MDSKVNSSDGGVGFVAVADFCDDVDEPGVGCGTVSQECSVSCVVVPILSVCGWAAALQELIYLCVGVLVAKVEVPSFGVSVHVNSTGISNIDGLGWVCL